MEEVPFSKNSNQYNLNDKTSIAYYLNHDFYDKLDKTNLIEGNFYIGSYSDNYSTIYKEEVKAYVGLMSVTDNFINDFSNYYLLTPATADMVYAVLENGRLSIKSIEERLNVRPVIYINKNINVTGTGSIDDPLILE